MGISEKDIKPHVMPFIRSAGRSVNFSGIVKLHVKVNDTTCRMGFLVVDAP